MGIGEIKEEYIIRDPPTLPYFFSYYFFSIMASKQAQKLFSPAKKCSYKKEFFVS